MNKSAMSPMRYPPIDPKHPCFLHGGDYNPEQWLTTPGVIDDDFRLAGLAHVNTFTVGVFSWMTLEPSEGVYAFDWLDRIMDRMANQNMAAVLATPSGARPAWMSFKYPEVLRVTPAGQRMWHEGRHNHCFSSPIYREKVRAIDLKLAERYHNHPALSLWHISNEFSGECHCDFCYTAFRDWLRKKYVTLDALNAAWWTAFWSHGFSDWNQIEPRDPSIDGLKLDWKRFITDQTVDFMKNEIAAIRQFSQAPVTTNMMGTFEGLNYWKFAKELDVISWDCYPFFHDRPDTINVAVSTSFVHDVNRSMKGGKPFMLMESSPSAQNWAPVNKLKRPGLHRLLSLHAVAHGADTVQYFQWRKNRGSAEKFHGAVVDHCGHENTRVFREVADIGAILEKLPAVIGTTVAAEVAIVFDWENRWAIDGASGPKTDKHHHAACIDHYRALWQMSVPTDVIDADQPLDKYKIVIAPMLYMIRSGVAERIEKFVAGGGTFVTTYLTGISDENDLCFLGGWPGPLRTVLGIWAEEVEALYDDDRVTITTEPGNGLGLAGKIIGTDFCDLIHAETAKVAATYTDRFFAGRPAVTVNPFGKGQAIYLATRFDWATLKLLYTNLIGRHGVKPVLDASLPEGVTAQCRTDGQQRFIFVLNFNLEAVTVNLGAGSYINLIDGKSVGPLLPLDVYGVAVLSASS
jgi:beta-galactosidase